MPFFRDVENAFVGKLLRTGENWLHMSRWNIGDGSSWQKKQRRIVRKSPQKITSVDIEVSQMGKHKQKVRMAKQSAHIQTASKAHAQSRDNGDLLPSILFRYRLITDLSFISSGRLLLQFPLVDYRWRQTGVVAGISAVCSWRIAILSLNSTLY
ncbi:hypothetical protein J6590_001511 [Homalodisca vitripennis]|nr:hypothetical protein J6590_001511 [Homalodisca vitripennis]